MSRYSGHSGSQSNRQCFLFSHFQASFEPQLKLSLRVRLQGFSSLDLGVLATSFVCFSDVSAVTFWIAPFHHMPPCPQCLQLDPGEMPWSPQFNTARHVWCGMYGVACAVQLLRSQWACPTKKVVLRLFLKGSFLTHHLQWGFMADFQHNTEFILNSVFLLPVRSVSVQ